MLFTISHSKILSASWISCNVCLFSSMVESIVYNFCIDCIVPVTSDQRYPNLYGSCIKPQRIAHISQHSALRHFEPSSLIVLSIGTHVGVPKFWGTS